MKGLENLQTGSWHQGDVSTQQAINGAMKVITELQTVGMTSALSPRQCRNLIDLCLNHVNNEQACDNFNIVYLLHHTSLICGDYRKNDIEEFAKRRFRIYMDYYHSEFSAFSFRKKVSNICYYGCNITKGKNEPDLHGTFLFMWGLYFLSCLLGINDKVCLKEVVS